MCASSATLWEDSSVSIPAPALAIVICSGKVARLLIIGPTPWVVFHIILAADAALYLNKLPLKSPVIGILAFDTPYYGLNHTIFTEAAYERVSGLAQKASGVYSLASAAYLPAAAAWSSLSGLNTGTGARAGAGNTNSQRSQDQTSSTRSAPASGGFSPSSLLSPRAAKRDKNEQKPASAGGWGWGSIALGIGAAVAATGAAIVVNKHMNTGMEYVTSHIQFVGILWNNNQLQRRYEQCCIRGSSKGLGYKFVKRIN